MRIRAAGKSDFAGIRALASRYDLDYDDMEADRFWMAVEEGRVAGICGLKKHPDCLELCSLAVDESCRGRGWGRRLVSSLLRASRGDVYLTTVNPAYFEALGFRYAAGVPASMDKDPEWCLGCNRARCRVMVKQKQ